MIEGNCWQAGMKVSACQDDSRPEDKLRRSWRAWHIEYGSNLLLVWDWASKYSLMVVFHTLQVLSTQRKR